MAEGPNSAGLAQEASGSLARQTVGYLLARGVPGAVNFAAIALYTRLLAPGDYGTYTLVVAAAGLANALGFQWLYLSLTRFLPIYAGERRRFLSTLLAGFSLAVLLSALAGALALLLWGSTYRRQVLLGIPFLWALAWFTLNLELTRAELAPGRYGWLSMARALLGLAAGGGLAYLGRESGLPEGGPLGLLLGVALGCLLPTIPRWRREWQGARPRADWAIMRLLLLYGLPLTGTAALSLVMYNSDRFIIQHFLGREWVGLYAAGYDLADQTLVGIFMVISLPAAPLVFRALERGGMEAARRQFLANGRLFALVAVPAAVALLMLTQPLVAVIVGARFRVDAARVFPWVMTAALLQGLKFYYIDSAFLLARRPLLQTLCVLPAAAANAGLNFWLIPLFGIMGAAYTTVGGYALALVLAVIVMRRVMPMPVPVGAFASAGLASGVMALAMWGVAHLGGPHLLTMSAAGAVVYFAVTAGFRALSRRQAWQRLHATAPTGRIVLCGERYSANLGDGVIAECLAGLLRRAQPDCEIEYLDLGGRAGYGAPAPLPAARWHRRLLAWRRYRQAIGAAMWRLSIKPKLTEQAATACAGARLLVIGGGQLLLDNDLAFPRRLQVVTAVARRLGVPVCWHACGVAAHWSPAGHALFAEALAGARSVSLRSQDSVENLRRHLPSIEAGLCPDPACWAGEIYGAVREPGAETIGLGIAAPAALQRNAEATDRVDAEALERFWVQVVSRLVAEGLPCRLFTNGSAEDIAFARRVLEASPLPADKKEALLAPRPSTPAELVRLIAGCRVVVACRLHAAIVACAVGVPVAGLLIGGKLAAFAAQAGFAEACVEWGKADAAGLLACVRAAIAAGVDEGRLHQLRAAAWLGTRALLREAGVVDE